MSKSKKKAVIAAVVIILSAFIIVGGFIIYNRPSDDEATPADGVVGKISDDWDPGLEEESSAHSTGTQIPGYSTAEMNAGDTSLHLSVGNPKENNCGFYATLMLADGTVLYKSELLNPGCGLTEVPLSKTLEKGEYDAMVFYECVTLDEKHSPLNAAESEFKLIVK